MDAQAVNTLRGEQVESLGRLMAGFSHEMKNHFGIIRESGGLIADLLAMHGHSLDEQVQARMQKAVAMIEQRIVVAAGTLHLLSGFAHRSDQPLSSFSPHTVIEEVGLFLERFARLSQVTLVISQSEQPCSVYNDPSLLQHVVYRLFMHCLHLMNADDTIVIHTSVTEQGAEISFELECKSIPELSIPDILQLPLSLLQAEYAVKQAEARVVLTIPSLQFPDVEATKNI
ncbi:sensor histidine kinase [Desulfogranum japonicum]|uniref:hypothetical protein n=1 Tax=Desulfogranum japonicum TaxID=231447 RepID=UPI0003F71E59|nr:hypothetical protein [Desulfogranum japonicum]